MRGDRSQKPAIPAALATRWVRFQRRGVNSLCILRATRVLIRRALGDRFGDSEGGLQDSLLSCPHVSPRSLAVYGVAIMGTRTWTYAVVLTNLFVAGSSGLVRAQDVQADDASSEAAQPTTPLTYPNVTPSDEATSEYTPLSDEPSLSDPFCPTQQRRACVHVDLGLHGYLVSDTKLLGGHLGIGYEWFSFRGLFGAVINNGVADRFNTSLLGPYFGGLVSAYILRSERFEARAGLGAIGFWLCEISSELTYVAGIVSVAGSWYFLHQLGAFIDLQVMPLSSNGLTLGYFPGMLQIGMEVTL